MPGEQQVDVVVVGAGPAGEVAAGRLAEAGLSVAIVERELVGGECAYWACIPSKALIRPGDVVAAARRVEGAAPAVRGDVDAAATFATRHRFTSGWDDAGALPWLEERGVTLVRGTGRLAGERTVDVTAVDGTVHRLVASRVVLATGTRAARPPVPGLAEAEAWDNRGATEAKAVPPRLLVLGGGPVGVELAQAFRRLGSGEVTVLEGGPRLLAREEPFASTELRAAFEAEGIDVRTSTRVERVARDDATVTVTLDDGTTLTADQLLVATGRTPATGDLGLEVVGLEPGRPVEVDDQLRARGVDGGWLFAVGDCNGRSLLTHMGKYQARVAADVILGREVAARADHTAVPRVTFTDPQVAAVGLTEEAARAAGLPARALRVPTGSVSGTSLLGSVPEGSSQLVVDADRDVVLGATFVGAQVQELLHAATVAVAAAVPRAALWHAVPSFPTVSEVWLGLLEAWER